LVASVAFVLASIFSFIARLVFAFSSSLAFMSSSTICSVLWFCFSLFFQHVAWYGSRYRWFGLLELLFS
jgi:hypothetical protein